MSFDLNWVKLSGFGEVLTFSIVYQAPIDSYKEDVPYILAIIKLREGPQMMANIFECDPYQIEIGMKVKVMYEEREGFFIPQFQPA